MKIAYLKTNDSDLERANKTDEKKLFFLIPEPDLFYDITKPYHGPAN